MVYLDLNKEASAKLSSPLRDALTCGSDTEIFSVILTLEGVASQDQPSPKDFASREDYRRALIAHRRTELAPAYAQTLDQLRKLQLEPIGGTIQRLVAVRGTRRRILAAIKLLGVKAAYLDQQFSLNALVP